MTFSAPNFRLLAPDSQERTGSGQGKPLASVSLDLDNKWSYMKIHGDSGWETFPSYLDILIPHSLDVFDRHGLKITFFIVGQDATSDKNGECLQLLTKRGHEVGNHSFHHNPWIHLLSRGEIERDISDAEARIERVTGQRPLGFRGPGFSWSPALLSVLHDRGYLFDASTLPTYLGPLARFYYFRTSSLSRDERQQRKLLFGGLKEGLRPVKPYRWRLSNGSALLELPVTTIPGLKTPFHLSYLLLLSRFSPILMNFYLKLAITLCRLTGTQPSFLLHPLDFLGVDQVPELAFFPGMNFTSAKKVEIVEAVLSRLARHFTLVNMSTHAESVLASADIPYIDCVNS